MITVTCPEGEVIPAYQEEDSDFLARNGRAVLGHKTGMGKSLIALLAASKLKANKILVLGGTSAGLTWKTEPDKWCGTQTSYLNTTAPLRAKAWQKALVDKEGIWFCTYQSLKIHMDENTKHPAWDLVIADELHKLRSRKKQIYKNMLQVKMNNFIGASATWASRGPQDLWSILHLMDKQKFSSYWKFVAEFCHVENTGFGVEVFGVRNLEKLRNMMYARYFRSRTWEEIGYQVPPIRRASIKVEMDHATAKVYKDLDTNMWATTDAGESLVSPTSLAKLVRLHQLAALPSLLFPSLGNGPALTDIMNRIEDDPHTVIYTMFAEAIPIIAQVAKDYGHEHVYYLKGGTPLDKVASTVAAWKATKGIMICTIQFAESFRIDTTHTAYVLGFSWDPNENIQAEGRLRAVNSPIATPVVVYYYIVVGTVMEAVQDVTNGKAMTVSQIFHDYATLKRTQS